MWPIPVSGCRTLYMSTLDILNQKTTNNKNITTEYISQNNNKLQIIADTCNWAQILIICKKVYVCVNIEEPK